MSAVALAQGDEVRRGGSGGLARRASGHNRSWPPRVSRKSYA